MSVGSTYHQTSDWQERRWQDLVALIAPDISANLANSKKTLLDLGCGTGKRTLACKQIFTHLESTVGIDSDATMIQVAKNSDPTSTYFDLPIENVSSLSNLTSPRSYDVVLAHYSLHWLKQKQELLNNLNSITRSGSFFLIGTCSQLPKFFRNIDTFIRKRIIENQPESPFFYLQLDQWRDLLQTNGWTISRHLQKTDIHTVSSGLSFLEHWHSASAGKAFYGLTWDTLTSKFNRELEELVNSLNAQYGIEENWQFQEETLLLVATRNFEKLHKST